MKIKEKKIKNTKFKNMKIKRQNVKKFNFQGINNLSYIISSLFLIQLLFRNIRKYGLLLCIPLETLTFTEIQSFFLFCCLNLLKFISIFYIVKHTKISFFILCIYEILIGLIINLTMTHLYFSFFCVGFSLYVFVKIVSFILENKFAKEIKKKRKMQNTLKNYFNFLLFPTVIYQRNFRRKIKINYLKIIKKFGILIITSLLLNFFADQIAIPTLNMLIFNTSFSIFLEYFLILSIVTIIMFFLLFIIVFICVLPIFAEITYFRNRKYFSDWWNKRTVGEFWASWNKEMHHWFKSYIFKPMVKRNYSKRFAVFMCFFVSGMFHEYAISVSSKTLRFYTFFGFMAQLVLMETTDRISKAIPSLGNYLFWMMFCVVGQPICIWLNYKSQYNKYINLLQN